MNKEEILLEQYKVFVKTADDITARRLATNKFYLTILLGLFTIAGFLKTKEMAGYFNGYSILILISVLGMVLSVIWYMNIESFRLLNSAKFKVIHEMEKELAYPCFDKEWEFRKGEDTSKAYPRFTQIEKYLPIVIGVLYSFLFLMAMFG
ncbi:MAG: Unknown protein [uncultured Sulfurovum sp.]|uniref:Uncharacterized protein n=1 Tax=uncultured Sulfurovum sp. TaxID=269237 RepID=A0A6S6U6D8_9BACT|nr:MAG: Unknown protein [uncultured Sulfurovum sp.]